MKTIRHYSPLFALFVLFAIRDYSLFAIRYSRLFAIRYSGFPDTRHECGELSLLFMEDEIYRKGCASSLRLLCENCGWIYSFYTSKQQGKSFEVNRRIVYSMRTLGKGHTGAKKFCSLMSMPPPPAPNNYAKISKVITTCLQSIAKESMSKAAEEIRILKGQNDPPVTEPVDCGVSFDGTWQKRELVIKEWMCYCHLY